MVKTYLKQAAYGAVMFSMSSIIVRLTSFMVLPFFLQHLTVEEFGIWDFYQLFFSLGSLALTSSVTAALTRYYFVYNDDPDKRKQALGNAFLAAVCISGSFFIATLLAHFTIDESLHNSYAMMTAINVALFSLSCCVLVYVRVRQWLLLYLCLFAGQSVLAQLLTVYGVYRGSGVTAFFYANGLSYLIFIPFFVMFGRNYRTWSWSIAKEQIVYSTPLLLNNLLYTGFFSIDRLCITYASGYATLGMYALLWRFGAIVQFLSMAIWDAWLIMIFDAHKHAEQRDQVIANLISYGVLILASLVLAVVVGSQFIIAVIFPAQYHGLSQYLPLFLLSLFMLELARLVSVGCTLAARTQYMPVFTCIGLGLQVLCAVHGASFGLWAIIGGNCLAFSVYCLLCYWLGTNTYSPAIVDTHRMTRLLMLFSVFIGIYQVLLSTNAQIFLLLLPGLAWPWAVWYLYFTQQEKTRIISYAIHVIVVVYAHMRKRLVSRKVDELHEE